MKKLYIILLILPLIGFGQGNVGYLSVLDGILFKTTDSGNTWVEIVDIDTLGMYYIEYMSFVNETTGYITDYNDMWKTTDSGETWIQVFEDFGTIIPDVSFSEIYGGVSFVNETTGYLSVLDGILFKTTDSGNTWVEIVDIDTLGMYYIEYMSFVNETTGYITDYNDMWKTTDSGETWIQVFEDFGTIIPDVSFSEIYGGVSFVNETNISTIELPTPTSKRELVKTINILGQENTTIKNQPMIEIYDDGSVEKKYIVE